MAGINDIIDEYLGVAISPEEMRDLALMQVNDASVQDDAVQKAVANAQGAEARNRSALEEYLRMADEQAAAESQRALEMAQQRLNALDQNASLLASTVGLGKEGKQKLASIEAERQAILQAFPQLGKAGGAANEPEAAAAFDIAKMLKSRDYSPETIAKFFDENDKEMWKDAIRSGDLDFYQALLDYKLGDLPEGMADWMRYSIAGKPETSKELKLNDNYARLRGVIGETQGDLKKKARDEAAAAKKKKESDEENELLTKYAENLALFMAEGSGRERKEFVYEHPDFYKQMAALKKAHKLPAEAERLIEQTREE